MAVKNTFGVILKGVMSLRATSVIYNVIMAAEVGEGNGEGGCMRLQLDGAWLGYGVMGQQTN